MLCTAGILLPVWTPLNPSPWDQAGRATVYFLCLMYLFLGVSIIADRFMASIEVITSQVPICVCVCASTWVSRPAGGWVGDGGVPSARRPCGRAVRSAGRTACFLFAEARLRDGTFRLWRQ